MSKFKKKYSFLFKELVKRDFKRRYQRTFLGVLWSILSPLGDFIVMKAVFTYILGRSMPHYSSYLFAGILVNHYFQESTTSGMGSLVANARIITKINVPKYIFLLSKNVACLINFGLTLVIFIVFLAIDNIEITWKYLCLIYPTICLIMFNIGVGLILSALFVFFKDIQYLYQIFLKLLAYVSAIFYSTERFPEDIQKLFYINPVYDYITYFREITLYGTIPDLKLHLLCFVWAVSMLIIGIIVYRCNNNKFVFYF